MMIDKLIKTATKGLNPYRTHAFGGFPSVFFNDPFFKNAFKEFDSHFKTSDFSKINEPAIDIKETDNAVELTADVPGYKKDAIKVDSDEDNRLLTLKGEYKEEKENKDEKYHIQERRYSNFQRSFVLPENVKLDQLKAQLKDGQLKIVFEKIKEQQKPKTKSINIQEL